METRFAQEIALATALRKDIITMLTSAGSGHPAGALGMADVFAVLMSTHFRAEPAAANSGDKLILSNGHICPVLYASLVELGYVSRDELRTLRRLNSKLQGHPHGGSLPLIETSSGPLGQGLSQAAGLALASKMLRQNRRIYCIMSDGEHQEGQTWEAYMFAAKARLANLTVVVDRNHIQIGGPTEKIMPLEPLVEKVAAFGWEVLEIDGHSYQQIDRSLSIAASLTERPTAIICNTVPGKGVSFMENDFSWHGKAPTAQEAELALAELTGETHGNFD